MRVADYLMETIYGTGAAHLFMVTGRGVLFLSDAAAKLTGLTPVPMHHEQSCAYAAYAYAALTGRMGACLVSTGCASTNAVTGALCAWQDGVPCVFLSGQNMLHETARYTGRALRTWGQQEADIVSIVTPITKYAVMLTDARDAVYETEKALYLATHGHKGPVWIDVPLDIQNARIEPEELRHFDPAEGASEDTPEVQNADIAWVSGLLSEAERPVLLIGSGIRWGNAREELMYFAEKNHIPVAYCPSAPDAYPYDMPLSMGSVGMMGCSRSGNFAVQNSDLLLAVGCRLSPMTTGPDYEKFARAAKVVVVDVDAEEHRKGTVRIDRFIHADCKAFLRAMEQADIVNRHEAWVETCAHWKKRFPLCEPGFRRSDRVDLYQLAEALSGTLPEDAVFLCDAGLEELILPANIVFGGNRRCIHPQSQGAMGFALPGAVGACCASGRPVEAVIGDGSVMMNLQELATIAYRQLPIRLIIVENGLYSVIRKRQKELFRTRTVGTDAGNGVGGVDFEKLAACFGFRYLHIDTPDGLQAGLETLFAWEGPAICTVRGAEDQSYIACEYGKTATGRLSRRPLEDQAPFLPREEFLSEMVIDPIDQ